MKFVRIIFVLILFVILTEFFVEGVSKTSLSKNKIDRKPSNRREKSSSSKNVEASKTKEKEKARAAKEKEKARAAAQLRMAATLPKQGFLKKLCCNGGDEPPSLTAAHEEPPRPKARSETASDRKPPNQTSKIPASAKNKASGSKNKQTLSPQQIQLYNFPIRIRDCSRADTRYEDFFMEDGLRPCKEKRLAIPEKYKKLSDFDDTEESLRYENTLHTVAASIGPNIKCEDNEFKDLYIFELQKALTQFTNLEVNSILHFSRRMAEIEIAKRLEARRNA